MGEERGFPYWRYRHVYNGVTYPNICLDSSIDRLRTFEVRPDDIWVVTYPKAGTHWMMEIVGLILSDGYPEKVDRTLNSACAEMINMNQAFPQTLEEEKEHPVDMTPFLEAMEKAPSPRKIATHLTLDLLPEDILKSKVIYVSRNPKDIILSWYNFVGKDPANPLTMDKAIQEFLDYTMCWGSWPKHVRQAWELRDHPNMTYVCFEDLKMEPAKHIKEIASKIGHPLSEDALQRVVEYSKIESQRATFKKMADSGHEKLVKAAGEFSFINKGQFGRWKSHFTVAQNETFDKWYDTTMGDSDIRFTFE